MYKAEFTALCKGVDHGEHRFVENRTMKKAGKVVRCEGNRFRVEVEGEQFTWPSESCKERWDLQ